MKMAFRQIFPVPVLFQFYPLGSLGEEMIRFVQILKLAMERHEEGKKKKKKNRF